MSYYSRDVIDDLVSKLNIIDVIGRYVTLTKKGSAYFGLCPFHGEKTPSFCVNENTQLYYCFGCHEGGNVITFIEKYENLEFTEAVEMLAEMYNINLPKSSDKSSIKETSKKKIIFEINRNIANYYYKSLYKPENKYALDYLLNRGLTFDTIKKFGLGYSEKKFDLMYKYLIDKGFKPEDIAETKHFVKDEKNGVRDKFFNRIMFPILDVYGNVIAFGGRVLGDFLPKYINSSETKYYIKRNNLFGFNIAKKSKSKYYILCEGYMDTISLHQYGFDGAFASLGTSLTTEQVTLINRLYRGVKGSHNLYLIYDNDDAGNMAKARAIPMLRDQSIVPRIIDLSPYKDPDEFCNKLGCDEFIKRLDNSIDGLEFMAKYRQKDYDLNIPSDKTNFIFNELCSILVSIKEPVERNIYIQKFAETYNIPIEDLEKLVRNKAANKDIEEITKNNKKSVKQDDNLIMAEKQIISYMVQKKEYADIIKKYITLDDFTNDITSKLYEELSNMDDIKTITPSQLINKYEDEDSIVASCFQTDIGDSVNVDIIEKNLKQIIIHLKENTIKKLQNDTNKSSDDILKIMKMQKALQEIKKNSFKL